jgi:F0F1-type ATP synthase gamma subunit
MSFASEQYKNAVKFKANLHDKEENDYSLTVKGKSYHHFFKKTPLNLWESIREDALEYFSAQKIHWHTNTMENNPETIPEGNMCSSQISCVNHLFHLRKNHENATAILKNIDNRIISADIVCDGYGDDGYVEFESCGTKKYNNPLNEKSPERKRGEKTTSIDAVMVGKKNDGKNILVLIEWKFTEDYTKNYGEKKCKYIEGYHNDIYDLLLNKGNCPIHRIENFKDLYYNPFYQLMRQTLWGWKMIEANEFGCDEYVHLHIIPKENLKIQAITSPNLKSRGKNMSNVWESLLKEPSRYKLLTPEKLLYPLRSNQSLKDFFDYLSKRYLEKYI